MPAVSTGIAAKATLGTKTAMRIGILNIEPATKRTRRAGYAVLNRYSARGDKLVVAARQHLRRERCEPLLPLLTFRMGALRWIGFPNRSSAHAHYIGSNSCWGMVSSFLSPAFSSDVRNSVRNGAASEAYWKYRACECQAWKVATSIRSSIWSPACVPPATLPRTPHPTARLDSPVLSMVCVEAAPASSAHVGLVGRSLDSCLESTGASLAAAWDGTADSLASTGLSPALPIEDGAHARSMATAAQDIVAMPCIRHPSCGWLAGVCILMSFRLRCIAGDPSLADEPTVHLVGVLKRRTGSRDSVDARSGAVGTLVHIRREW